MNPNFAGMHRSLATASTGCSQHLTGTLGAQLGGGGARTKRSGRGDIAADGDRFGGGDLKLEVNLEMVHDEVDNASDAADSSVTLGSGSDGEIVDVEFEVSQRPPPGADFDDGAKQQPQLNGGKPLTHGDVTRCDKSA